MTALRADSPIQYVRGVGPKRAELFTQAGIHTVADLLRYFPFRHEQHLGETDVESVRPGDQVTIRGTVTSIGGKLPAIRVVLDDGTGQAILRWFDRRAAPRGLFRGATLVIEGTAEDYDGELQFVHPRARIFSENAVLAANQRGARLEGVYRAIGELSGAMIRRAMQNVLVQAVLPIDEPLPEKLRRDRRLPDAQRAVRQMHEPDSEAAAEEARRRLAYEELLLMELAMALRRRRRVVTQRGQRLPMTPEIDGRIRARFPFALTASQDKVIAEICADLASGRPMTRLLQGDVGAGKTVVALYACLAAIANGRQAAIMAPTELLAQQHAASVARYLAGSRVRSILLGGRPAGRQRGEQLAAIECGEVDLVIGTQALIQRGVAFANLAIVVVDEQHKFGVLQRHEFRTKGPMPHYLVMTATPIPRTLAMTVYGDLDVSIIRERPPGRGQIATRVVPHRQWDKVMQYVRGRLAAGERAYVVCPQIGERAAPEESAAPPPESSKEQRETPLETVQRTAARLIEGPWQGMRVAVLHGELSSDEKKSALDAFARGELHALVATTVVEVGVDVPDATIMIVEHADRFGLSQLHQLRGRVGRGARDSLCVLIARSSGGKSRERLAAVAATTDGFKIAEADLRIRGPGELFGTRQHGLPELYVANIVDDFALLEQARQDAFDIIARDPELSDEAHAKLREAMRRMFRDRLALIDAA